jgi:two-component system sensor histidine kinase TtrS
MGKAMTMIKGLITGRGRTGPGGFWCLMVFALALFGPVQPVRAEQVHGLDEISRVGVLANKGLAQALKEWSPLAEYLDWNIPGYQFELVPLDFDGVRRAVENKSIDFLITNSGYYIELESTYGVSRIATRKTQLDNHASTLFGGVIFTRVDRKDINTLDDLKGKSFMAVEKTSLGGWLMAWRELRRAGIDPLTDTSSFRFGGTHDAVVHAVLKGEAEAGTVRTDTLERMSAEGKIDLKHIKVINELPSEDGFPFVHSTELYPEWPMAKLKHTPDTLAKKMTIALLAMTPDSPAARSAGIAGWTVPLDYRDVHNLMKELHLGPYRDLGQVTFAEVVRQYYWYFLGGLIFLAATIGVAGYVVRLNRHLERTRLDLNRQLLNRRRAEEALNQINEELERRVEKRTLQLSEVNQRLVLENQERRQVEADLRGQKEFNENIIGTAAAIIISLDRQGHISEFNRYAEELTGYRKDEVTGHNWFDLFMAKGAAREKIRQIYEREFTGERFSWQGDSEVLCRDGSSRIVSWRSSRLKAPGAGTIAILSVGLDVTEHRQAEDMARYQEEQLIQADKLVALGTLVAGVAHEINNPTASIMLNAPNAARMCGELTAILDEKYRQHGDFQVGHWQYSQVRERLPLLLDGISEGAHRVKRIVAELKDYARQEGSTGAVPVDVNRVVEKAVSLLTNLIKKTTKNFQALYGSPLPLVLAQPQRLEQVIINLVMNACEALPNPDRGVYVTTAHQPEPGRVVVTVRDEGLGIPEEAIPHLTDPFYTTKRESGGTGLGLAICARIIKDCGGAMAFSSKPGQGATVTVELPAVTPKPGRQP